MPAPGKWLWLAIILFLQILGPIAFFLLRRQHGRYMGVETGPATAPVAGAAGPTQRTATDTADLLYGRREDEGR